MKNSSHNISIVTLLCIITWIAACTKNPEGSITVTTKTVTDITESSAKTGGSVTCSGYSIGDCGVCYSESHNPTLNNSFTKDHEGDGSFNSTFSSLKSGTTYYVRAYAKTSSGIEYGNELSFTTQSGYTINVFANPTAGGTVTGAGTYQPEQNCTVTATSKTGYHFTNWTENGTVVSSDDNYTFKVKESKNLTANFNLNSYSITVSAAPENYGSVSGSGDYDHGQSCTVTATANAGYAFTNWTEDGVVVSTNASYTFTATDNRTLVANFEVRNYTIAVIANPSGGGVVSGGGTNFLYGRSCTVTATANSGYTFTKWTENGNVVSTNARYTFTVTDNRNLVANFTQNSPHPSDTWLQYDEDDDEIVTIWGYTDGGTMEWAVKFPSNMLAPYVGMKITKIKTCIGVAGTYDVNIYTGGTNPTTQILSGYCTLNNDGWWTITLHEPVSVTAQNLWIALSTTHEAGTYPAGSTTGSNNPNARWVNWGTNGWCDAYTSGWANQDLIWIIRAFVTDDDKGCEIELSPFEVPLHQCAPKTVHTSQGVGKYKRTTK